MDNSQSQSPALNIGDALAALYDDSSALDVVISRLSQEVIKDLVIVGGQSLKLWGELYLIDELTGEEYPFLSSYDLDLLGVKDAVVQCAEAWGGDAILPEPLDPTPCSGAVTLKSSDGTTLQVDFLKAVYGVPDNDVKKYSDLVEVGGKYIRVLSPPLCLKSRICNLVGLYGESSSKSERELVRIKLAAQATRIYLISALENGDTKRALKIAKYLIKNVFLSTQAVQAARKYNAEFLHALPHLHGGWPPKARECEFPKQLTKISDKYSRRSSLNLEGEKLTEN